MIITKTIDIRLNRAQKEMCMNILYQLNRMWNDFIAHSRNRIEDNEWPIGAYAFDTLVYQIELKPLHPDYATVPGRARQHMFITCHNAIYDDIQKRGRRPESLRFRSWQKRPVSSFFFEKSGVRFLDESHIWVPILHSIKLLNQTYLKPSDIPMVTGGRIIYDKPRDKWKVLLHLNVDEGYLARGIDLGDQSAAIGIDVGVSKLLTYSTSSGLQGHYRFNGELNPATDEKTKLWEAKITHLTKIIDHKTNMNARWLGYKPGQKIRREDIQKVYHSKRIDKLRQRVAVLYGRITRHRKDAIRKACVAITKANPEYVCIENLDRQAMRAKNGRNRVTNKTLRRRITASSFGFFAKIMEEKCRAFKIDLIEADVSFDSTQRCSCCHQRNRTMLSDRIYSCKYCGLTMDRDINAATNLLQYGAAIRNYHEIQTLGSIDEYMETIRETA